MYNNYSGIIFLNTRKSDAERRRMQDALEAEAARLNISVSDCIVNDENYMELLTYWIERECIKVILLRSIKEIADTKFAQKQFLTMAAEHGVSVHSMEQGCNIAHLPWDGGFGC